MHMEETLRLRSMLDQQLRDQAAASLLQGLDDYEHKFMV